MTINGIGTHSRVTSRPVGNRVQPNALVADRVEPNKMVKNRVEHQSVADRVQPNSVVVRRIDLAA